MAAKSAATEAGTMLVVIMTTMAARMMSAGMAPGPSGTVWRRIASGESTSSTFWSRVCWSRALQPPCSRSVSPALTGPVPASGDLPAR